MQETQPPEFYTVGDRAVLLRVKAKPRAREDGVIGIRAGELMIAVRAPAEKGKANAEVIRVVARALGLPRESVVLKSGGSSPHKVFVVPLEAVASLQKLSPRS
ncbi:MAG: DUF167 domain-containing protein [Spirochaetia bacterium]